MVLAVTQIRTVTLLFESNWRTHRSHRHFFQGYDIVSYETLLWPTRYVRALELERNARRFVASHNVTVMHVYVLQTPAGSVLYIVSEVSIYRNIEYRYIKRYIVRNVEL